jgi:hypothetical protein
MDDWLLGIDAKQDPNVAIEFIRKEVKKIGLEVNTNKCGTTKDGGKICFLG